MTADDEATATAPAKQRVRAVISTRTRVRDLALLIAAAWLVRGAFVAVVGDVRSNDVGHWIGALEAQDRGENPYETGVLNWPPLWLVVIVCLDAFANVVDVSFWTALRLYLVMVESALMVTLYLTLLWVGAERRLVRRALLVGIALNPVAILLTVQHGNSDVQVGLLVTLAVAALIAHERSRDVVFWLGGCLLLGLGVLAKTIPLVLAPLLARGTRLASSAGRALGAALFLGPAALGTGVILALAPIAVWDHVISYRSTRGFFSVGGTLHLVQEQAARWYGRSLALLILALVLLLFWRLWRARPLLPEQLFLVTALVLMTVVAFGSGYGPQYAYWFLPALVATYVLLDDGWRRLLLTAYVVAGLTYAVEYAFVPWLGAYAAAVLPDSGWVAETSTWLDTPHRLVLLRLPLLLVYLVLLGEGIARLVERRRA